MANWLQFFGVYEPDADRVDDFLTFILKNHTDELLKADSAVDLKAIREEIGRFDRFFPFSLFDKDISLSGEARRQAREFFRMMISLREKVGTFGARMESEIRRDRAILKQLH